MRLRHSATPRRLAIATLLGSLLTVPAASAADATEEEQQPRIVGGDVVTRTDRPWMSALLVRGIADAARAQYCGASLISERWALTAAHCLIGERPSGTDVLIGRRDLNARDGERIAARRFVRHPDYDPRLELNDIALIELARPSSLPPVGLATPGNAFENPGRLAEVMGWGNLREGGGFSPLLQGVKVPVVAHRVCDRAYGGIDEAAMVCAGFADGGKDSCQGDSGGPLFVPLSGSGYAQIGIVSFGQGCARPGLPGVYTRVSNYYDWVSRITGLDDGGTTEPPPSGNNLQAAFRVVKCRNLVCRFNASASSSNSRIDSYTWDTGDGGDGSGRSLRHRYGAPGSYDVTLHVTNVDGEIDSVTQRVEVAGANADRTFNGTLAADAVVTLPDEGGPLRVRAGQFSAGLTVSAEHTVIMVLRQRSNAGWREIARARSRDGQAKINRRVEGGRYQLRLINRGDDSDYRVTVAHR
ncbi:MAG: trypsin-like serine protease [Pseudomonadota bacterium]